MIADVLVYDVLGFFLGHFSAANEDVAVNGVNVRCAHLAEELWRLAFLYFLENRQWQFADFIAPLLGKLRQNILALLSDAARL